MELSCSADYLADAKVIKFSFLSKEEPQFISNFVAATRFLIVVAINLNHLI